MVETVGKQIRHVMPEVSYELSQVNETLDGLVTDAGNVSDTLLPAVSLSTEGERILNEANALAEQQIKSRFPDLHKGEPVPA